MQIVTRAYLLALLAFPLVVQRADQMVGKNVSIAQSNYKGRNAIQVVAMPGAANATSYAVIRGAIFTSGIL